MSQNDMMRIPGLDDELPDNPKPVLQQRVKPSPHLICYQDNGHLINQRRDDGYFDATAMCRAYGKQFNDYRRLEGTEEYLRALESDTGIPVSELVQSIKGGPHWRQGTWVHPEVAIDLAQWLSPYFRVRVNRWILEWMTGRPPTFSPATEPFVIGKICDALQRIEEHVERTDDRTGRMLKRQRVTHERLRQMQLPLLQAAYGRDATCVQRAAAKAPGTQQPRTVVDPETGEVRTIPPLAKPRSN